MKNIPLKEQLEEFKTFHETNHYNEETKIKPNNPLDSQRSKFYLGLKYHTKKNSESEYTLNEEIPQIIQSA